MENPSMSQEVLADLCAEELRLVAGLAVPAPREPVDDECPGTLVLF
jgi:hypothetical protein